MTELKLHIYGEKLIVSEKVTIASGDINSAAIAVEFDNCWDNYPARTAIFKRDKDTNCIEVLMVDNKCTIPAELLQKNGTLEIGIRAASLDGEALKTSTKIRYTIAEGASPGTTTLTPTMDIYQQYLAAMKGEYDPLSLALKADYNAFTANILNILSGEERWTNPDTSVEFPARTVKLDLAEYKRICIVFLNGGTYSEWMSSVKGQNYEVHETDYTNNTSVRSREYSFNDAGVTFADAGYPGTSDSRRDNTKLIPVKIIGYKY